MSVGGGPKRLEREAAQAYSAARFEELDEMNADLAATYAELDDILAATLRVDDFLDLKTLRVKVEHPPFPHPELLWPDVMPDPITAPPEPVVALPPGCRTPGTAHGRGGCDLRSGMSETTQPQPVMAGSDDASNHDKLAGLIRQVDHDHGGEGAAAMAEHLRDRLGETQVEPEEPGDLED